MPIVRVKYNFLHCRYAVMALTIHFAAALLRCLFVFIGPFRLQSEEAQYSAWSQHLDWSYYSKPPLIAFCNYFTQSLFGHSEFSVRINAIVCGMLIGWFTYLFTYRLFQNERKAFWASMLVFVMPFYFEVSLFYSTDSILLLCWLLAAYFFWQASETNRWRDWIALGLAIGIGSLGKYAMLFYIPIIFLYVALKNRELLSNPRLYVALILGIVLFCPVIIWNINYQFIGYKHIENLSGLSSEYHWKFSNLADFAVGQVLLMSPLFVVMYWKMYKIYRKQKQMSYFLIPMLFIWTVFLFISVIKKREANINWAMFVYVGLPILLSSYIIDYHKQKIAAILSGVTIVLMLSAITVPLWNGAVLKRVFPVRIDPLRKLSKWKEIAADVDSVYQRCDSHKTFIFMDDYMLTSELLFYMYPNEQIYFFNNGTRMCEYQLWKGLEQYNNKGYDALFVQCTSISRKHPHIKSALTKNIADAFAHVEPAVRKVLYYRGEPTYVLDIYQLKEFTSIRPVQFTHY
jgi:hypothetical protein